MSIIHMDLCNELCLAGWLAGWLSRVPKTLSLDITRNLFNQFFSYVPSLYYKHQFIPLSLDLAWESQGQCKSKSLIFSHTFPLIRIKFDLVLKQFKLNIVILFLSEMYWIWNKKKSAVLFTGSKNFNVGMHSDVYELIWFKFSMIIDTIVLYILILVRITLTFTEGHRSMRKQVL